MGLLDKLLGGERQLKKLRTQAELVDELESEIEALSDDEMRARSLALKNAVQEGKQTLDESIQEAFALVREAAKRTLGQRHYPVQLMGGIVLHQGGIAEMRTGEGKTLASTAPIYLNALDGKGIHIITVNDYLARRDAVWMGQIYHALGLSVACLTHEASYRYDPEFVLESGETPEEADDKRDAMGAFKVEHAYLRPISKGEAYAADITYGTNHEFGFDYLRDNTVFDKKNKVQRGHNFAIIDEIDSVLIDEAKTPLIIAAPDNKSSELYKTFARIAKGLGRDTDYAVDEKFRTLSLEDPGIEKVEKILNIDNIYNPENFRYVHFLEESIRAEALFKRDKDYVVKDGEIIIVDAFTGRMLHGRRYSGGLHQAIEAKEGVLVKEETKTVASITVQNFFRQYKKLAGMTGTAATSAEEFSKVYGVEVVTIPTNKPTIRDDMSDTVYKTAKGKYDALVKDVKERSDRGQPILIGTVAIEKNEVVATFLRSAGIKHEVLNAKNHEREGEIIAQAGRRGAVTVATNMAGRGVDIVLGGNPPNKEAAEEIKSLGGLHVIGTERHDSRRIDNQLRGRAGRQGDAGSSQFFLSLEDDLMRIFGGDKIKNLMNTLKVPEDVPIASGIVSRSIEQAQSRIEGFNFDARQNTLEYDDVINKQRQAVYDRRARVLVAARNEEIMAIVEDIIESQAKRLAPMPIDEVKKALHHVGVIEKESDFTFELDNEQENRSGLQDYIEELAHKKLDATLTEEAAPFLKLPLLQMLDNLWMGHLENIDALRESVRIRAYGQHDPLVEFKREGFRLFQTLFTHYEASIFSMLFRFNVTPGMKTAVLNQEMAQNQKELHPGFDGGNKGIGVSTKSGAGSGSKVGRNDPCPCGSGKKFKKCHGA